jgi:transcriptional regulator with XRE-family HTH domain
MQTNEKLKVMRQCKGWTQEEIAEKLDWSLKTYSKIERGEADIKLEKLQQIAEIMGVNVEELVNSDDKTVFNFAENHSQNNSNLAHCTIYLTEAQCVHELEKARLQLELKDKELAMKDRENDNLREIIALLKREPT